MKAFTLAVVGLVALASAYPDADKVTTLDQMPDLSFGLYSGYVAIPNTKKKLHYMAALSQGNPLTDPIVIWFNGGPGCSSMLGFSQENGPYVNEDGTPGFIKNDYAWNLEANMMYLENPAGVGYSVCGDPEECKFDDKNSADDNLQAVLALLAEFKEIQNNDLYLAGESYAGIYIPQLATRIDAYNTLHKDDKDTYKPSLKGFAVGNGVTDWKYDATTAFIEQAYWYGIVDDPMYHQMKTCDYTNFDFNYNKLNATCKALVDHLQGDLMANVQPYDLFGKCYYDKPNTLLSQYSPNNNINELTDE